MQAAIRQIRGNFNLLFTPAVEEQLRTLIIRGFAMTELTILGNSPAADQPSMLGYGRALHDVADRAGLPVEYMVPPSWIDAPMTRIPRDHRLRRLANNVDRFAVAPLVLGARGVIRPVDTLHIVDPGNLIYLPYLTARRVIVTVHDMIPHLAARGELPGRPAGAARNWYLARLRHLLPRCDRIICVSAATRADLLRLVPLAPERVEVIHNAQVQPLAVAQAGAGEQIRMRLGIPPGAPLLLHIGRNFYKNRSAVLQVLARLRKDRPETRLVLVGATPEDSGAGVVVVPQATAEDLSALYAAANLLLFPSLSEGFGLPVIEAQAAGLPVICSDRGSLPEVAGEGALLCPPDDIEGLANAARRVLGQPALRARLVTNGYRNVTRFDGARWAEAYVQMWDRASRGPPLRDHARVKPVNVGAIPTGPPG